MSPEVTVQVICDLSPAFNPGGNVIGDNTGGDTTVTCNCKKNTREFTQTQM